MRPKWWLLLLITGNDAARHEAPLVYKHKRVVMLDNNTGTSTTSTTQWQPIANIPRANRVSEISTDRRACGFYVWNVASASMYHLCRYLMKDNVYEGKGGRKFVRIEPGSLLELLYPLSRHSPDQCVFCGGSLSDHLTLWWSKHIYSPLDLYLDRTYEQGVLQKTECDPRIKWSARPSLRCAFHTRYVLDISLLLDGITRRSDKLRKLQQAIEEDPYLSDPADMHKRRSTIYAIPLHEPAQSPLRNSVIGLVRNHVLQAVDALIYIQEEDNRLLQLKQAT